jgi:hypothetical protein
LHGAFERLFDVIASPLPRVELRGIPHGCVLHAWASIIESINGAAKGGVVMRNFVMRRSGKAAVRLLCLTAILLLPLLAPVAAHGQCPGAGNCYAEHGTPGCEVTSCCQTVCAIDSFCCEVSWDHLCAELAIENCTSCGGSGAGSCYAENGSASCNDGTCCAIVCAVDPFCCNTTWDGICVDGALELCLCGNPTTGDCLANNGTPGCDDVTCCEYVCEVDPFCCNDNWDNFCAGTALVNCGQCGAVATVSCFEFHTTPSCDDSACCDLVCSVDSFCCTTTWDDFCVEQANDTCCGGVTAGTCYAHNETTSCNNAECCTMVCAVDPFCCNSFWDFNCANTALELCGNCGDPGAGSCFASNGSPGCDDGACCATVCAVDAFCCDIGWDSICADEALQLCSVPCAQDCVTSDTFAPPPDGNVDAADLAFLLGDWGVCPGCCADTVTSRTFAPPPDSVVDAADLAVLLGAWGSPGCD